MVSFAFLPEKTDPDSFLRKYGAEAFESVLAKAVPISSYLVNTYLERKETSPPEKHSALLNEAARHISCVRDTVFREALAGVIAKTFDVPVSTVCKLGGWTRYTTRSSPVIPLPVQANRLETLFLSNVLRRPWEAVCLADDVEFETPGATQIVLILKKSNLDKTSGQEEVRSVFEDSPYLPYVDQLLQNHELDEPIPLLAKRLELAWVERRLRNPAVLNDPHSIREMIARKTSLIREIGDMNEACCVAC